MITTARVHMNPGKVAEPHNKRAEILKEKEKHIRADGIHEVWVRDQTLEEAYEELFGEAIEEYNKKQKKKCRRLTVEKYIESIEADSRGRRKKKVDNQGEVYTDADDFNGKRTSIELVVSVGNTTTKKRDERGRIEYEIYRFDGHTAHPIKEYGLHEIHPYEVPYEVNRNAVKRYWETFEERHPHFHVVRVDWHADEGYYNRHGAWEWGTPHGHGEIIGWAEGYKTGLAKQVSLAKAMRAEGYKYYRDFNKAEQEYFEQIVKEEYTTYAAAHLDYAYREGKGVFVDFAHPVAGKDDVKNLDPATFRRVQALKDEVSSQLEQLDETRDNIEKMSQKREELTQELEEAGEEYRRKRKSLREADEKIRKAGQQLADADIYKEQTEQYLDAMSEEIERLYRETTERLRRLEEDYERELEAKKREPFDDGDRSRREFQKTHTLKRRDGTELTYEEAYQHWLRQQRGTEESERKITAKEKRERLEEDAARVLAKYREEEEEQDYGKTRKARRRLSEE